MNTTTLKTGDNLKLAVSILYKDIDHLDDWAKLYQIVDGVCVAKLSSAQLRAMVWRKSDGVCWYCGTTMNPFEEFSIDHFHPKCRLEHEHVDNLVPACRDCNNIKSDASLDVFRERYWREYGEFVTNKEYPISFWFECGVPNAFN